MFEDIFWQTNEITQSTETKISYKCKETLDDNGEVIVEEQEIANVFLYINIKHKTLDEMIKMYNYNDEQKQYLYELLSGGNNQL